MISAYVVEPIGFEPMSLPCKGSAKPSQLRPLVIKELQTNVAKALEHSPPFIVFSSMRNYKNSGGTDGHRTRNLLVANQVHLQIVLQPRVFRIH